MFFVQSDLQNIWTQWTQINKNRKHHALNDKLILINVEHCLHSMQEWLTQINLLSYESYIPFCLMWTSPISNQRGPFSKTTILNAVLTLSISKNKNILFTLIFFKTTILTVLNVFSFLPQDSWIRMKWLQTGLRSLLWRDLFNPFLPWVTL